MTQQPLPLDPFEHVLDVVLGDVDYSAYKAQQEIKAMCERERRSLWQTVRWNVWRMSK